MVATTGCKRGSDAVDQRSGESQKDGRGADKRGGEKRGDEAAVQSGAPAPQPGASAAQVKQARADVPENTGAPRVQRVVLLTVDAMRGDQPWTGYDLAKTPNLSQLVTQSVVYTRAYAISNTTGPSISGLLGVRHPTEMQRDDCPLAGFTIGDGFGPVLERAGVWTAAVHGHSYFSGSTAPNGGFVQWKTVDNVGGRLATEGAVTGHEVTQLLLELLQEAPTDKPSMLWAHYLEPHDSYVYHKDFPPSSHPKRGVYDGEVAFVDHEIGKVLRFIEESSFKDRTAVIVAADHGEAFGEHDRYRHGFTVFEEEVHVPLIVRVPGQKPRSIDTPRSCIDIPRTVAQLLGVEPPQRWRGESLLKDFEAPEPEARPVIVDVPKLINLPAQQAVLIGQYKIMKFGPKWSVYDLAADPKEKKPLSGPETKDQVDSLIEQATRVLETIETVPSEPCKRQAFRPK